MSLGVWPFDSEQDKNLDADINAAATVLKSRAYDKLPLTYKAEAVAAGLFRDVWGDIIRDYMSVSRSLQRPYTNNAEFYTVWEPRMEAAGYQKQALEILFAQIRGMIADGSMPPDVADPAHKHAAGDDGTPLGAIGRGVEGGLVKVGIFAVIAIAAYGFFTGAGRGVGSGIAGRAAK